MLLVSAAFILPIVEFPQISRYEVVHVFSQVLKQIRGSFSGDPQDEEIGETTDPPVETSASPVPEDILDLAVPICSGTRVD